MRRLLLLAAIAVAAVLLIAAAGEARIVCNDGGSCVDVQGTPTAPNVSGGAPKTPVTPWQARHWAMLEAQSIAQAERFAYGYGVNRCKRLGPYVFRCGIYIDVFDPAIHGNVRCTQQLRLYRYPGQEIGSTVIGGAHGTRCSRRS